MNDLERSISNNFQCIQEQITRTAKSVNRSHEKIRLVVVSKGHSLETIQAAISAGAMDFGENYVEEGVDKILKLSDLPSLCWHMIGHIQSRKAKDVCKYFNWIHSLDSVKLANRLNRFASESRQILPVLLECNTSGEETKFGLPAWNEEKWKDILAVVSVMADFTNIKITGLMTMAPFLSNQEMARPFFRRLRELKEFLSINIKNIEWRELSMGMSSDFKVAIEEGATIVRIGQSILGPRPNGG